MTETHGERRDFARTRYKAAITGSLIGKGASLLMLIATMLAYRFLGEVKVGLLGGVVASVNWMATASLGCGPVVMLMIAEAVGKGDKEGERKAFVANFWIMAACALILGAGISLYFLILNPARVFAPAGLLYADDLNWATGLAIFQGVVVLMLTTFEISRDGYQETGRVARALAVGVFISTPLVLAEAWWTHSIALLLVTTMLLPLVSRVWLALRMVMVERPYLWGPFDWPSAIRIIRGNAAYSLVQLGSFANVPLLILMVTKFGGAAAAGGATLIFSQLFMQGITLITQLTQPMVPSLREGFSRGDHDWTSGLLRKFVRVALLSSVGIGLIIALLGPFAVHIILPHYVLPVGLLWLAGAHFVLFATEFVFTNAVIAVWRVAPPSFVVLARTIVSTGLMFWLAPKYHEQGASLALILGLALTSAWMLPLMLTYAMNRVKDEPETA